MYIYNEFVYILLSKYYWFANSTFFLAKGMPDHMSEKVSNSSAKKAIHKRVRALIDLVLILSCLLFIHNELGVVALLVEKTDMDGIFERALWNRGKDYSFATCSPSHIKVAVLGGSIACGHGSNVSFSNYLEVQSKLWHGMDPSMPEVNVAVGAIPATGVEEPTACLNELVGDPDQFDVFIVEFSINEASEPKSLALYRRLESLPRKPLVLVLDFFSKLYHGLAGSQSFVPPSSATKKGEMVPFAVAPVVAAFKMNLTVLSLRTALAPIYDVVAPFNDVDLYHGGARQHMNHYAHELAANILYHHLTRMPRRQAAASDCSDSSVPMSPNNGMCYSTFSLTDCRAKHDKFVVTASSSLSTIVRPATTPSLIDLAKLPLSAGWGLIRQKGTAKAYLGTVSHDESAVGVKLELQVKSAGACRLRLTALVCSKPPYCELGAFTLVHSSWKSDKEHQQLSAGKTTKTYLVRVLCR